MIRIGALLAAVAMMPASPTHALESATVQSSRLRATLVPDTDFAAQGTPLRSGLRLRIALDWHIYWQNPGDTGAHRRPARLRRSPRRLSKRTLDARGSRDRRFPARSRARWRAVLRALSAGPGDPYGAAVNPEGEHHAGPARQA